VNAALLLLFFALDTNPRQAPPAPPKALTACTVVTRVDVEMALGRKFVRSADETSNGSSTCDYSAAGAQVTVTMQHLGAAPDLAQEKRSLLAEFPGSSVRETQMPGAAAFFVDMPDAGTLLYVLRGGRDYVMVAILGCGAPEAVSPAALKLARVALK
jgi:hypothetical protein